MIDGEIVFALFAAECLNENCPGSEAVQISAPIGCEVIVCGSCGEESPAHIVDPAP